MADQFPDSDEEDNTSYTPGEPPPFERPKTPHTPTGPPPTTNDPFTSASSPSTREAALQRELSGVRQINELIEGVIGTLERARGNMGTVSKTVNTASTLLNTWTRILSQTEHSQRLLLNPDWKGASQDMADAEEEERTKSVMAERRAAEEERRKSESQRRREEEERARQAGTTTASSTRGTRGARGTRGRTARAASTNSTRGAVRGGTATGSSAHGIDYSSSSIASARSASGIGRGFLRGRSRGARGSTGGS
ncbi:DASH complex subunit Duo1-domain-containing protein [Xylariales sp. AK1849]|nr:DASH complex subunit Duo1-domain-containing protein [Xylariales sp. AK1849]